MRGIFLDLETTGLDSTRHCPIDIAFKVVDLGTGEVLGQYQSLIRLTAEEWDRRDPSSIKINGYTWEQISKGKEPFAVSQEIIGLLSSLATIRGQAVFICQNPAFDRGFFIHLVPVYTQEKLNWPYHWLDLASMYWMELVIEAKQKGENIPDKTNLSKNSIATHYNLLPELPPHHAMGGVNHLIQCYQAVLNLQWNTAKGLNISEVSPLR